MNKVAALQMCPGAELAANLQQAEQLIRQAASDGAKLVVLPENFAYPGARNMLQAMAHEHQRQGPARQFLAQQAQQHNVWIIGGTLPIADGQTSGKKAYAASLVFNTQGEEAARYNKIHLFDVDVADRVGRYRESERYLPGQEVVVVDTEVGRVGLSVCYDLRFPELYRQLVAAGAEILVVPSAFTAVTGEAHWQVLLRARAIENLCYVIAPNQGDRKAAKPTWGGSCVIDPWGAVLAEQMEGPGVVMAAIDLEKLRTLRNQLPALEHQRLTVVQ